MQSDAVAQVRDRSGSQSVRGQLCAGRRRLHPHLERGDAQRGTPSTAAAELGSRDDKRRHITEWW